MKHESTEATDLRGDSREVSVRGVLSFGERSRVAAASSVFLAFPLSTLPSLHHPDAVGMVGRGGLEPPTLGLRVPCSSN